MLQRCSGILQPIFSLRSAHDIGIGDFGACDGLFAWLQLAQQKLWMLLPLLPTAAGVPSPYATCSAFGLNPLFIHLNWLPGGNRFTDAEKVLIEEARQSAGVRYDLVFPLKYAALERAFAAFETEGLSKEFDMWRHDNRTWLRDYALFVSLSEAYNHKPWWKWPKELAAREAKALELARTQYRRRIRYHEWLQWVAMTQWETVRRQAKKRGIAVCGDEPFIVGQDSADCWVWPKYLHRDKRLGVPPDDFSDCGQDWGLPFFDFEAIHEDGGAWLKVRAQHAATIYDIRRIDHAVGYFRQYLRDDTCPGGYFVPAEAAAQQALGERNFRLLSEGASIIAEDLGSIPRFVRSTLARLGVPGYQVMRWSREDGVYLAPQDFPSVSVVTTGTHDTETLASWWNDAPHWEREAVCRVWPELQRLSVEEAPFCPAVHHALLEAAINAQSMWCVLPWEDVFGETQRINTPGTVGAANWTYRMHREVESLCTADDTHKVADFLAQLTQHGRRF